MPVYGLLSVEPKAQNGQMGILVVGLVAISMMGVEESPVSGLRVQPTA